MSDCTVSGSPGSRGLQVVTEGKGTFERCLLFGNAHHNLQVLSEGNPTLLDCRLSKSGRSGASFDSGGKGWLEVEASA